MKNSIGLFIIDPQNDFCNPSGSLFVNNADQDMIRLGYFINQCKNNIDDIMISLDAHNRYDIAHPLFWVDKDGNHPEPFTIISLEDIESEKWIPNDIFFSGNFSNLFEENKHEQVKIYAECLKENAKLDICVWPPHCIVGTEGFNIFNPLQNEIEKWEKERDLSSTKIIKGLDPFTEHYSAVSEEVQMANISPNNNIYNLYKIIRFIKKYDIIVFAGEASSHCVSSTIREINKEIKNIPSLNKKFYLLKDCTSPVAGFEHLQDSFFEEVSGKIEIVNSIDLARGIL